MISPINEVPSQLSQSLPLQGGSSSDPAVFRSLIRQLGGETGPANQTVSELADRLAETGAKRMMADAFLMPLLKELRESTAPEGIFAPGTGEKRFGTMYDQKIADRMLDSNNFPVAEALVDKLRASFQRVAGLVRSSEEANS